MMIPQDLFDIDKLVCTFCAKKPVVGFTVLVDASTVEEASEKFAEVANLENTDETFIAVCAEHLPILQEKLEAELGEDAPNLLAENPFPDEDEDD
jgi:hypothetical protein